MRAHCFHWMILGFVGFATTTPGWSRWIDVMPSSTLQVATPTRSIAAEGRVPLVVDGFRFIQNGASMNPPPGAEGRRGRRLRQGRHGGSGARDARGSGRG